ncbi:MAG: NAD(P)H-dependent oxidoreductase subunit E [Candidatus Moraniibacteriota bacterium]
MQPTIQKILLSFDPEKRNVLPALKKINKVFGYISQENVYKIAQYFSKSPAEVFSTVSFYDDLRYTPPPSVQIKLCMSVPCELDGASQVMQEIENFLGAKADRDKTPKLEINSTSCHGRCQRGPVMVVNENVYEQVKPEMVDDILGPYFSK